MEAKKSFLEALLSYHVLEFGDFTTKSGRKSPYFFNTGRWSSAHSLGEVAELYAEAYLAHWAGVRYLFGPAYKGIPLAVVVADRVSKQTGADVFFTFNRKEAKEHGEGGTLVGYPLNRGEEVVIIEDVLTGGTSIRQSLQLLAGFGVKVVGALVGIDREERGTGSLSARQEIEREFRVPVHSLITLREIVSLLFQQDFLGRRWLDTTQKAAIDQYLRTYGAACG